MQDTQLTPRQEILRACKLLMAPGDTYDVRVIGHGDGEIWTGQFNDSERVADAVLKRDGTVKGSYLGCNPTNLPAKNRLVFKAACSHVTNILGRTNLFLDFDRQREKDTNTTDEEHELALDAARSARDYLRTLGFPEPIFADSGNGGHLLYRINWPNDGEVNEWYKALIAHLQERVVDGIKVDNVSDAPRITKAYGSMACKAPAFGN